ncbi:MAG TPA: Hpt domain-containing protein [Bacteroidetes bacterium]|nr:Hpt domain-containing protein [Bacteroidota bacterium]
MTGESEKSPRIDISNLRAIANGDDSFVAALLMKMCKALPIAFSNMENFVAEQDWAGLKSAAHKAKSTFAYLELNEMQDRLKHIEHCCMEDRELDDMPRQVGEAVEIGKKIVIGLEFELAEIS